MKYSEKSSNSSKQSEAALLKLFQELDVDGNESISRDELLDQIEDDHPKLLRLLRETKVDDSEGALSLFDKIEDNDDENISFEEFKKFFGEAFEGLFSTTDDADAQSNTTRAKGRNLPQTVKTKFVIQRCQNEQKQKWESIYRGSATSHRVLGLQPGKPYRFRILTISADGVESAPSDAVVIFTTLETPEPPKLSSQSPPTSTTIRLRWSGQAAVGGGSGTAGSTEGSRGASRKEETEKILSEWTNTEADDGGVNIRAAFARYDLDKDGTINLRPEFKLLLEDLGIPAGDDKLMRAFNQFDENQDGHISLDEFTNWFNGTQRTWVLKRDEGVTNPLSTAALNPPTLTKRIYRDRRRQYEVKGLAPNTLYHFALRATSATCQSALSRPVAYMTAPGRPSAPAIVKRSSTSITVRWHAGENGAARYRLQVKFVELLSDAIAGGSRQGQHTTSLSSSTSSSRKQWKTVFEGSETIGAALDLLPDAVYRLRLVALNLMGNESEPSDVSQTHTYRRRECPTLRPSNAHEHFTIDVDHSIIVGDTILFTERLYKSEEGKLLNDAQNSLNVSTTSISSRRILNASVASYMSQRGYNIGERTIAANVVRIIHNRSGN